MSGDGENPPFAENKENILDGSGQDFRGFLQQRDSSSSDQSEESETEMESSMKPPQILSF